MTTNELPTLHGMTSDEFEEINHHSTVLLLDTSSSMSQDGKIEQAKSGAKGFAEGAIAGGSLVALIRFDSVAEEIQSLTTDLAAIDRSIAKLRANGNTNMGAGIALATDRLRQRTGNRAIFIVTDGMPQDEEAAIQRAAMAKAAGIDIQAIGVDNANLRLLRELASDPNQPEIVSRPRLGEAIKALAKRIPRIDEDEF